MLRYIFRRVFQLPIMFAVLSLSFFLLIHALPGGPDAIMYNPRLPHATRLLLRHHYGLDQSLPVQYLTWLSNLLHGDLGNSFVTGQPVTAEIGQRIPTTLELMLISLLFALTVTIMLGVVIGIRKSSVVNYVTAMCSYFGLAMPTYWFALTLQLVFGVKLHLLPVYGRTSLDTSGFTPLQYAVDLAAHFTLPVATLSLAYIAMWNRYLRASLHAILAQDYILMAHSKGLSWWKVMVRHAMPNALNPLISQVAVDFGSIFTGAVVTETIFGWAGLGRLFFDSLASRDYPILLSTLLLGAVSFMLFNLVADVLYAVVDPRIRYS